MNNLRIFLIMTFFTSAGSFAFAQKIGVVDTNYILSRLAQYQDAQKRLDAQVLTWEKEIQNLQKKYDDKKSALENERVLLVGDKLKDREKEVNQLNDSIKMLITKRFGTDGEISKLRSSLVVPFQDQIYTAIKMVAEKNSLGIVFDKSNNISVIFLDKKYDYTDKVLDLLTGGKSGNDNTKSGKTDGGKAAQRSPTDRKTDRGSLEKKEINDTRKTMQKKK